MSAGRPGSLARGTTTWLITVAGGLCLCLVAAGCAASAGKSPQQPGTSPAGSSAPTARPLTLQVTRAAYHLPSAISREVVLARGRDLLIIGGITQQLTTTDAIIQLDTATGRASHAGRLASPAHDAAGAVLGGRPYLFGGGDQAELATVQALRHGRTAVVAGHLPGPRSDISSVTLGGTAYLVGGYDGASWIGAVLATTNGRTFTKVATLPVPVRYAAVAGAGKRIWVFGGLTPAGNSRVIQRINLATGKAAVVGHMPAPISAATAVTLAGRIFIAGGQVTKGGGAWLVASRTVLAYNPVHSRVTRAGRLPVAVTNAAAAVIGSTAYLVGGNNGNRQVTTVAQLRLIAP